MTSIKRLLALGVLVLAPACVGQVQGVSGDDVDAAPPGADTGPGGPDAAPPATTFKVSGTTKDYGNLDPLPAVALATEGMQPPMSAQSDVAGLYELPGIGAGNAFLLHATGGANYVSTLNPGITVLDTDVVADVFVASVPFRDRQYNTVNIPMTANTSLVVSSLEKLDGTPIADIPLTGITLVDMLGQPVPGVTPYFVGVNGDVDPALTVSTIYGARGARVAFLNVPTGAWIIKVTYTPAGGLAPITDQGMAMTFDNGVTITKVIEDPTNAQGGTPSFTTDVYPILQKASKGGQDCASCHTAGGVGAVLIMDDGAAAVYARLKAAPGVIDLATPANSMLLSYPLYETPPNHPNATWLDTTNPYYQKILLWITGGAPI